MTLEEWYEIGEQLGLVNEENWLYLGVINNFCSMPFCSMHEHPPHTKQESNEDFCATVVRLGNESKWYSDKSDHRNV
jgi:hypothetical protein